MYADDKSGVLALNDWDFTPLGVVESPTNSWVTGNTGLDTNTTTITEGTIYPYVKNIQCYRCSANHSMVLATSVPILRTYSLSCFMGGPQADTESFGIKPVNKFSQIRSPSRALTFLEEDDSTIDDGHFLYSDTVNHWFNLPAWTHQNGVTLAFADGHAEYWKWQGTRASAISLMSGGAPSDPLALQDVKRLQRTAAVGN